MNNKEVIIKNKTSSNLILSIGGLLSSILGLVQLTNFNSFNDEATTSHWTLGLFFLPIGIGSIFNLLDSLYVKINKESIEIKSFFRKRMIHKKDIQKYGIGEYEGKHVRGERIRIFTKKASYKFHTTQLESIDEIKDFVKGKEQIDNAFKREELTIYIIFFLTIASLITLFMLRGENVHPEPVSELEAIGIPVKLNVDMEIIKEQGDSIIFKLHEYKDYTFIVAKTDVPKNFKTIEEEIIVFITNKEHAQELSGKENLEPKEIPVDGIDILQ